MGNTAGEWRAQPAKAEVVEEIKKSDSVYPSGRSPLYLSLTLTDIDIKTPACSLLLPCQWFRLSSADWADFIASPA